MGPEITLAFLPCQVFFLRLSVFSGLTHRIPSFSWLFLLGTLCAKSKAGKPLHRFRDLHKGSTLATFARQDHPVEPNCNDATIGLPHNEDLEWGAAETHRLRSIVVTF